MPPKKGKAKAGTPVKAAAQPEPPASVTTNRGKEIATTAAAGRPRRDTTTTAATQVPALATKKRGRPAKATAPVEPADDAEDEDVEEQAEPPKKRGRPSKASAKAPVKASAKADAKKGAKPKTELEVEEQPASFNAPAPRKRGRPPKGGETTKVASDDAAAADQLEEELVEVVEEEATGLSRKRKVLVVKQQKKPTKADKSNGELELDNEDRDADGAAAGSERRYWLMKAEQEDREEKLKNGSTFNTKFTIDDLRSKSEPEPWDGVRNVVARNNMRAMKQGDLCFFYASGGKQGRKPGITGIMEVVKEHEPDMSAFDESAYGYEEENNRGTLEEPKWSLVHVAFHRKLTTPVNLAELQKYAKGDDGVLSKMQVIKSSRTSVTEVAEKEWNFIVDNLIEGYVEDEDALPAKPTDNAEELSNGTAADALPSIAPLQTTESDALTTDTIAAETVPTSSRPASRAASNRVGSKVPSRAVSRASRQASATPAPLPTTEPASAAGHGKPASRAGSVKPASRAGSLAPLVAPSRGRSRTPKPRTGSMQPSAGAGGDETATTEPLDAIME